MAGDGSSKQKMQEFPIEMAINWDEKQEHLSTGLEHCNQQTLINFAVNSLYVYSDYQKGERRVCEKYDYYKAIEAFLNFENTNQAIRNHLYNYEENDFPQNGDDNETIQQKEKHRHTKRLAAKNLFYGELLKHRYPEKYEEINSRAERIKGEYSRDTEKLEKIIKSGKILF